MEWWDIKRINPAQKHFLSIATCLKLFLVFGIWESGVGLQLKIFAQISPDIRGVDGDDILLHSRS